MQVFIGEWNCCKACYWTQLKIENRFYHAEIECDIIRSFHFYYSIFVCAVQYSDKCSNATTTLQMYTFCWTSVVPLISKINFIFGNYGMHSWTAIPMTRTTMATQFSNILLKEHLLLHYQKYIFWGTYEVWNPFNS